MSAVAATDEISARARVLARSGDDDAAVEELAELGRQDRSALEASRNQFATALHRRSDDFEATAALRLLNRALSKVGWPNPYDWRVRWSGGFGRRKP